MSRVKEDYLDGSVEICDTTFISLKEVFPNPTKEQIDLWDEEYGDYQNGGVFDEYYYYEQSVEYIRSEMNRHLKNMEVN